MQTISEITTYTIVSCNLCGMSWGCPSQWLQYKRTDGGNFYCPNGHVLAYAETENMRLKKQLESRETELRQQKCETLRQQQLKEQAIALKEKSDRQVRRLDRGVCKCCNRTFTNLQRHMQTKHPTQIGNKTHGQKTKENL